MILFHTENTDLTVIEPYEVMYGGIDYRPRVSKRVRGLC